MLSSGKILLVLDLDETLVHTRLRPLRRSPDFVVGAYMGYRRPGLQRFLSHCAVHFDIAIWSAATADYVAPIVMTIMPDDVSPALVWSRTQCTLPAPTKQKSSWPIKDLRALTRKGYRPGRILVVDDKPWRVRGQPGNSIPIRPYRGNSHDMELDYLATYLYSIHQIADVRELAERMWRERLGA